MLIGFIAHALAFAAVNAALFAKHGVDFGAGYFWGWGIGLGAHALLVLGPAARWRDRLIDRELARGARS
jgi:hypothetical protein